MTTTQGLARDLPETALHAASPRLRTQASTAQLTCSDMRPCEALHGDVNYLHIDGKDGVAGSIPAGGSTQKPQLRPRPAPDLSLGQDLATAFARELPVRLVRFESGCVACRGHPKASLMPVGLTLEFVHGRSRSIQRAPGLRLGRSRFARWRGFNYPDRPAFLCWLGACYLSVGRSPPLTAGRCTPLRNGGRVIVSRERASPRQAWDFLSGIGWGPRYAGGQR
jgi:hypothetical protein